MPIAPYKKKEKEPERKIVVTENRKVNPDAPVLKKLKAAVSRGKKG